MHLVIYKRLSSGIDLDRAAAGVRAYSELTARIDQTDAWGVRVFSSCHLSQFIRVTRDDTFAHWAVSEFSALINHCNI